MNENGARFRPTDPHGHYESWFLRANHPARPLAFWIRYTILAPRERPQSAEGELWAIAFDGERQVHTSVYQCFAAGQWTCATEGLDVVAGTATLSHDRAEGEACSQGHRIQWNLSFRGEDPPLLLLPPPLYDGGFPQAKSLVAKPRARFAGRIVVDEEPWTIEDWIGSQNHNWGVRHTSRYAWGQVMAFRGSPGTVLECATARNRVGPLWTPWLSVVVARHEGREYRLNSVTQAFRARGRFYVDGDDQRWTLRSRNRQVAIEAEFSVSRSAIVELTYRDPPGGTKLCRNTKLASCTLKIASRGGQPQVLDCPHSAAFEILEPTSSSSTPAG